MHHLIYFSTADHLLSKHELIDILTKAREKNNRLGVTGMLLYKGGNFMQLLEGRAEVIRELYEAIRHDQRHHSVTLLLDEATDERLFPDWTMGFQDLSEPVLEALPGFAPFRAIHLTASAIGQNAQTCLELLRFFRDSR